MKTNYFILLAVFSACMLISCKKIDQKDSTNVNSEAIVSNGNMDSLVTKELAYPVDDVVHRSYLAYKGSDEEKQPVVFILPEWWGVNDYVKSRAKQIAELGYIAVVVDYYGEGKVVENPEDAGRLSGKFYQDPVFAKKVFDAAVEQVTYLPNADMQRMAIMGYCFGGAQALNMARQSTDFKGAVSFHGNLSTGVRAQNNVAKYLVFNGGADTFVSIEEIQSFKKEMDSAGIKYEYENYPGALHAFTNPASTETGKKLNMKIAYDENADKDSWNRLIGFLAQIFNQSSN